MVKKGRAFVRISRYALAKLLMTGKIEVKNGFPPDANIVSFEYNQETDSYKAVIESVELKFIPENCPLPEVSPEILNWNVGFSDAIKDELS